MLYIYNIKKILALLMLAAASMVLLFGCLNGNDSGGAEAETEGPLRSPSIELKNLEIIDINGNDLYPGDEILAIVELRNSGEADTGGIRLDLAWGDSVITGEAGSAIEIGELKEGEEKRIEAGAKIKQGIEDDLDESIVLEISKDDNVFFSTSREIKISGVKEYKRNKIPIIGLHDIEDEIEIPIELSTSSFDLLCSTLKDFGYETITFSELLKHLRYGKALPDKAAIITSDDGYQGNHSNAFPVLKKYGFVMTVFLVTGVIADEEDSRMNNTVFNKRTDVERPMLIWPEIHEMDEYGCEFLSHTENHIRLGLATDEEALDELISSRMVIEKRLGKDVDFFAWPFDNYSEDKWPLIEEAGYEGAVRYWGGTEDIRTIDLRNIKRVEFNSYVSPSQYAGYLELFDLSIEGRSDPETVLKGREVRLQYSVQNNEEYMISLSSIELELPEGVELSDIDSEDSRIKQFPALHEGIYMWVGEGYDIDPGSSMDIVMRLKVNRAGEFPVKFRVTSNGSYIEADDLLIRSTDG
jgi:peptidoglycan/xylan/chitin deacetylase (PgdA/CDA1 family)